MSKKSKVHPTPSAVAQAPTFTDLHSLACESVAPSGQWVNLASKGDRPRMIPVTDRTAAVLNSDLVDLEFLDGYTVRDLLGMAFEQGSQATRREIAEFVMKPLPDGVTFDA